MCVLQLVSMLNIYFTAVFSMVVFCFSFASHTPLYEVLKSCAVLHFELPLDMKSAVEIKLTSRRVEAAYCFFVLLQ